MQCEVYELLRFRICQMLADFKTRQDSDRLCRDSSRIGDDAEVVVLCTLVRVVSQECYARSLFLDIDGDIMQKLPLATAVVQQHSRIPQKWHQKSLRLLQPCAMGEARDRIGIIDGLFLVGNIHSYRLLG